MIISYVTTFGPPKLWTMKVFKGPKLWENHLLRMKETVFFFFPMVWEPWNGNWCHQLKDHHGLLHVVLLAVKDSGPGLGFRFWFPKDQQISGGSLPRVRWFWYVLGPNSQCFHQMKGVGHQPNSRGCSRGLYSHIRIPIKGWMTIPHIVTFDHCSCCLVSSSGSFSWCWVFSHPKAMAYQTGGKALEHWRWKTGLRSAYLKWYRGKSTNERGCVNSVRFEVKIANGHNLPMGWGHSM